MSSITSKQIEIRTKSKGSTYSILSTYTSTHDTVFIENLEILCKNLDITKGLWSNNEKVLRKLYPKMFSKLGFDTFIHALINPLMIPAGGIRILNVSYKTND